MVKVFACDLQASQTCSRVYSFKLQKPMVRRQKIPVSFSASFQELEIFALIRTQQFRGRFE